MQSVLIFFILSYILVNFWFRITPLVFSFLRIRTLQCVINQPLHPVFCVVSLRACFCAFWFTNCLERSIKKWLFFLERGINFTENSFENEVKNTSHRRHIPTPNIPNVLPWDVFLPLFTPETNASIDLVKDWFADTLGAL